MSHKNNSHSVTKQNELVRAGYSLTLDEQRLLLSMLHQVNPKRSNSVQDGWLTVTADNYSEEWGIKKTNSYRQLKDAAKGLYEKDIRIENTENNQIVHMRWVTERAYELDKKLGYVKMRINPQLMPYLTSISGNYTKYYLLEVSRMQSQLAIRLFELLKRFDDQGWYRDTLTNFRFLLNIKDKYPDKRSFNGLLKRICKEISLKSTIIVSFDLLGGGRGKDYTDILFTFKGQELPETTKQLGLKV